MEPDPFAVPNGVAPDGIPNGTGGPPEAALDDQALLAPRPPSHELARSGVRILRPVVVEPAVSDVVEVDDEPAVEHTNGSGAEHREPPRPRRPNVLGVNIAGGMAHLAVVDTAGRSLLKRDDCVAPPEEAPEGVRLAAFSSGIAKALRANDIGVVAVARPVRYTNWTYRDAFDRISLETCVVLEAERLGVHYESVGQHHAANVIGLPLERLGDLLSSRLAVAKTRSWPDRWPALLVALATAAA